MNKVQREIMSLIAEIDKICEEYGITYVLSPPLTLRAVFGRPLSLNPMAGYVVMTVQDMERFRRAFAEKKPERRALESMDTHKYYPGFSLRYENLDTTCYSVNSGRNYQYPGIGVGILPLRGTNPSRRKRRFMSVMEQGWLETCDNYGYLPTFRDVAGGLAVRALGLGGRGRLGKKLYRYFAENMNVPEGKKVTLRYSRTGIFQYPAYLFKKTRRAELEGFSFRIPYHYGKYLQLTFGEHYEGMFRTPAKQGFVTMASTEVPCGEFLREIGSQRGFARARRRQYFLETPARNSAAYFENAWNYVKLCGAGRNMCALLEKRSDYIQNLYECRDYLRLEGAFRPYTRFLERRLEKGEFYPLEASLMEIYLELLRMTGKAELAEKLEGMKTAPAGGGR